MPLTKERKLEIITDFGANKEDTGNTKVQIALITERIKQLTEHLKIHKKDHHTRYGLMKLIGQRRSLLDYLIDTAIEDYRDIIKKLGIRK